MQNNIPAFNVNTIFLQKVFGPYISAIFTFDYVGFWFYLLSLIPMAKIILASVSFVLTLSLARFIYQFYKYEHQYVHKYLPHEHTHPTGAHVEVHTKNVATEKWEKIEKNVSSPNPSDWRLAILEADIILDDLITSMHYKGESMGDKMKQIDKSDFQTLDNAWEAHRIRNQIAHEGVEFEINQKEARRVIELYKTVFDEFYYI